MEKEIRAKSFLSNFIIMMQTICEHICTDSIQLIKIRARMKSKKPSELLYQLLDQSISTRFSK